MNDVNCKGSVYILPTPVFTEEIGQTISHSECSDDFLNLCHQNTKQQRCILLQSCKNSNTNLEALFL